jgi:hypothetical protein
MPSNVEQQREASTVEDPIGHLCHTSHQGRGCGQFQLPVILYLSCPRLRLSVEDNNNTIREFSFVLRSGLGTSPYASLRATSLG